jgi:hypothetical protein
MAKLSGDDATVEQLWGQERDFAQRASEAVPDSVLRDIVNDARHGHGPRSALPQPRSGFGPSATEVLVPTFAEWAHQRMGVDWPEARAKAYYETKRTNGEDVGPVTPESPKAPAPNAFAKGHYGNAPLIPIGPPPGVAQLDRLMAVEDARWRAERAKNGGGF